MGVGANGPWLIAALRSAGAPPELHRRVTELIYDAMGDALMSLDDPANGVHVVETRNTLARAQPDTNAVSGDWINEIHPTSRGYALLAAKLNLALRGVGIR